MTQLQATARVFSGFPGVGKSHAKDWLEKLGYVVADSDSSQFSKEDFPDNYIHHIQQLLSEGKHNFIFVSTHDSVRQGLTEAGIDYTLVYPDEGLKAAYLERYVERGSPDGFIRLMENQWSQFIDSVRSTPQCKHIVLQSPEQYLASAIKDLIPGL